MQKFVSFVLSLVKCKVFVLSGLLFVSAFSLGMALSAEAFFNIEPCILCIYQRIPFAFGVVFSVIGLVGHKNDKLSSSMIFLSGIGGLINSGIALYQTGIQQRWWISDFNSCAVPPMAPDNQSVLENIFSAPTASCDEISWADPIFGLSLANYNIVLCFCIFVGCMLCLWLNKKNKRV